jgi:membrane fusion protein (multidrug efflux system)
MSDTPKPRRRDRDRERERERERERDRSREERAPRTAPAEPDDAITGLLAAPRERDRELAPKHDPIGVLLVAPPAPSRVALLWGSARRWLFPALLLVLAVPVFFWVRYQSQNVTSKNAAVRGHLAEIGTRLSGVVTKVEVDVGDRVKAGQVLVRLEDRHLRAEVDEARAVFEALKRTIDVEHMNVSHERRRIAQQQQEAAAKVKAADAQAAAAQIQMEEARREYALRESLFSRDGIVSGEDVRNAETRQRTTEAKLDEAQANSAAAKSQGQTVRLAGDAIDIQERKVGVLDAELQRAQARLDRAQADLDDTVLRAPEDGAIVRRIVQPGGSVEAGQPIISMWLGKDVWIEAWIDEDDIAWVGLGSVATVRFHSFPGREFRGVVDKVGLSTDLELPDSAVPQPRSSRMRSAPVVGVRIRLDDPPLELLPGLSAIVAIRKAG